jgi:hypothetical protein
MRREQRADKLAADFPAEDQGKFLRAVMSEAKLTREKLSLRLLVSKRTVDSWLLPPLSAGFRPMSGVHFNWAIALLQDEMLLRHYKPVAGSLAEGLNQVKLPAPDGTLIPFPSVYKSADGPSYGFEPLSASTAITHLSAADPERVWLVVCAHSNIVDAHTYLKYACMFRTKEVRSSVEVCTQDGLFYSLLTVPVPITAPASKLTIYHLTESDFLGRNIADLVFDQDGREVEASATDLYSF